MYVYSYVLLEHLLILLPFSVPLLREGKLRAIGVSNYTIQHLRELESAAVKPAVLQSEYHPFLARQQQPTLAYCAERRIAFEAYMSFGGTKPEDKRRLLEHRVVHEIAHSLTHSKSGKPVLPAQVFPEERSLQIVKTRVK